MKNDHLPIIQALNKKGKIKGEPPLPTFESPRAFEIQHHEINGIGAKQVGQKVALRVQGHIHSQHNDGRTVLHVSSVKPDSQAEDKKTDSDQTA